MRQLSSDLKINTAILQNFISIHEISLLIKYCERLSSKEAYSIISKHRIIVRVFADFVVKGQRDYSHTAPEALAIAISWPNL